MALAYPLVVLGIAAAIATLLDATDTHSTDWKKTVTNVGLMSSIGVIMVMITEEGFFRGWLWASLKRAGQADKVVLLWTTIAFVLWHVFAISLDTGFDLPAKDIPIYLIIIVILGLIWGWQCGWYRAQFWYLLLATLSGTELITHYLASAKKSVPSASQNLISTARKSDYSESSWMRRFSP